MEFYNYDYNDADIRIRNDSKCDILCRYSLLDAIPVNFNKSLLF